MTAQTSAQDVHFKRRFDHRLPRNVRPSLVGGNPVEFYALAKTQNQPSSQDKDWLESVERPTWPRPRNYEPLIYRIQLAVGNVAQVLSASVRVAK